MRAIDRESVADFMVEALAGEDVEPRLDHLQCFATPAGIPLQILSNCEELLRPYALRLRATNSIGVEPRYRLYVMTARHGAAGDVPVWKDEKCSPQTFHRILSERGLRAAYPYRPNVWQFLDLRRCVGMQLVGAASDLPPWDSGAPLRQHLHWIFQDHGLRLTHASTLGAHGIGVAFFGNSGAGKSGMTLAGLLAGLQTVGDDYVAISASQPTRALAVFAIIKQDRFGLSHIAELAASTAGLPENWKGKVELDAISIFPGAFASELEIRAVIVPRIVATDTPRLAACAPGEAMRALMRSNLHQFPGEDDDGMHFFGGILRRLRVFSMELSENFGKNGELVKGLIESL